MGPRAAKKIKKAISDKKKGDYWYISIPGGRIFDCYAMSRSQLKLP